MNESMSLCIRTTETATMLLRHVNQEKIPTSLMLSSWLPFHTAWFPECRKQTPAAIWKLNPCGVHLIKLTCMHLLKFNKTWKTIFAHVNWKFDVMHANLTLPQCTYPKEETK